MITRSIRLGAVPDCTIVEAHWGGQSRRQRVCVEAPAPQQELCPSFSLLNPGDVATVQNRRVEFRWDSCTNATSYKIMMRSTSSSPPQELWQGNTTISIVDVPATFGNTTYWYVVARLGNEEVSSNSNNLNFQQTPPPPLEDTLLDWDEAINLTNYPDLTSWPNTFRELVENRESIQSIVESRVIVRIDDFRCSACHFEDNLSVSYYLPAVDQNEVGGNIGSTTLIQPCRRRGCRDSSWEAYFAQAFVQNIPATEPDRGVKPEYLRSLIEKWISDGSRP